MGVLLLKLAGPLQSWGADSRFVERKTRHEPTKSGVVGILASALGRRREDSIDDLASLKMAVRIDQEGHYESDFQTAHPRRYSTKEERWTFAKKANGTMESLPLSRRYYLSDAVFVVAIGVEDERLQELANALLHPCFPLYLGRRACPPSEKLLLGCRPGAELMNALSVEPWQASNRHVIRRHRCEAQVQLEVLRDMVSGEVEVDFSEDVRDVPLSFSQEHRQYALRRVVHEHVLVDNPYWEGQVKKSQPVHDPMELLEEED